MSESLFVPASEEDLTWTTYEGDREKTFYDIKLKTGEVIECCYPNSYFWNTVLLKNGKTYKDEEVEAIRLCKHPLERD